MKSRPHLDGLTPDVREDILWRALKQVCKWEASNYYSESTWQEVMKDALGYAKKDLGLDLPNPLTNPTSNGEQE